MKGEQDLEKVRSVIEAVLVTADTPVTPGRLTALFDGINGKDVRNAVDWLNERYEENSNAFTIVEIGGGFQLATRQEFGAWVRKYHGGKDQVRLSQAALETLSIVAFKQPITRVEIDGIRGVNSSGVVRHLLDHDLVRISGRSEGIGKPMLFGTTREFLLHFGLKSLADLPKPRELEELLAQRYPEASVPTADDGAAVGLEEADDTDRVHGGEPVEDAAAETAEAASGVERDEQLTTRDDSEDERALETTADDSWSSQDAFVQERIRNAATEGAFADADAVANTEATADGLEE